MAIKKGTDAKPEKTHESKKDTVDAEGKPTPSHHEAETKPVEKSNSNANLLDIDMQFKLKAPLLVLMLLLFCFAGYLFQSANLHVTDLVDIQRIQYSAAKLYSLSFILFAILYGLVLALSMHFGHGQNWLKSLFTFIPLLIGGVILGVMFPGYMGAFVAFALAAGSASIFASRAEKLNLSGAWNTAGRALLVLAVLAFAVTFFKVNQNPDFYSNRFLDGAVALTPDLGGQMADAVQNTQLDESFLRNAISKDTFAQSVSTDAVKQAIETIPGITNFNDSIREKWAETAKASLTSDVAYNQFIALGTKALQNAQGNIAAQLKNSTTSQAVTQGALASIKKLPAFKQVTDNFALVLAFMVLSILSVVNFGIKIIAALLTWALGKLAFS